MGYILLCISLFAGALKGYEGKRISAVTSTIGRSVTVNIIRMGLCIVIGIFPVTADILAGRTVCDTVAVLCGILYGTALAAFVVTWLLCVRDGAYTLVNIFAMCGMFLTIALSYFVFGETVRPLQWIGLALLTVAILIMCSYSTGVKGKMKKKTILLLIVYGIAAGACDFASKLFVHYSAGSTAFFNMVAYAAAAVALLVFWAVSPIRKEAVDVRSLFKSTFWRVAVMAICLFANSFFKTMAAAYLTAGQLYPIYQSADLILSALIAQIFFKEKINLRCAAGLCLVFAAMLLLH